MPLVHVVLQREDECPEVQLEAAWIICNIFSGPPTHTRLLVEADVLAALVPLLSSPVAAVRDQAMWALGNCAGDSPPMRDAVLLHGLLDPLLTTFQPHTDITSIRIAVWTLCNCIVRKVRLPQACHVNGLPKDSQSS